MPTNARTVLLSALYPHWKISNGNRWGSRDCGSALCKATDIYNRSCLCNQIAEGLCGVDNFDCKYLASDLIENDPELFEVWTSRDRPRDFNPFPCEWMKRMWQFMSFASKIYLFWGNDKSNIPDILAKIWFRRPIVFSKTDDCGSSSFAIVFFLWGILRITVPLFAKNGTVMFVVSLKNQIYWSSACILQSVMRQFAAFPWDWFRR